MCAQVLPGRVSESRRPRVVGQGGPVAGAVPDKVRLREVAGVYRHSGCEQLTDVLPHLALRPGVLVPDDEPLDQGARVQAGSVEQDDPDDPAPSSYPETGDSGLKQECFLQNATNQVPQVLTDGEDVASLRRGGGRRPSTQILPLATAFTTWSSASSRCYTLKSFSEMGHRATRQLSSSLWHARDPSPFCRSVS